MMLLPFLRKLGVNNYDELTEEEKRTYREYEKVLQGRELTSKEVRQFLDAQIEDSIQKLTNTRLSERDDTFLKMQLQFLRRLTVFLDAPKREKEQLEALLDNQ
jgi:integrase